MNDDLAEVLLRILMLDRDANKDCTNEERQKIYDMRNGLVLEAVRIAKYLGYKAGFTVHVPINEMLMPKPKISYDEDMHRMVTTIMQPVWEPRFGVVAIIELPTGQVSWHLDSHNLVYDGHTNEQKAERIDSFISPGASYGESVADWMNDPDCVADYNELKKRHEQ